VFIVFTLHPILSYKKGEQELNLFTDVERRLLLHRRRKNADADVDGGNDHAATRIYTIRLSGCLNLIH